MITKELTDVIKAAASVTSISGQRFLVENSNGVLSQLPCGSFKYTNLSAKETAGTIMTLREFSDKYIQGLPIGHRLTDEGFSNNTAWYVKISDEITLNTQRYVIDIVKNSRPLSQAWANVSLLFIPCSQDPVVGYLVNQTTSGSAEAYSVTIKKITFVS